LRLRTRRCGSVRSSAVTVRPYGGTEYQYFVREYKPTGPAPQNKAGQTQ
jgi:hypothetical protein